MHVADRVEPATTDARLRLAYLVSKYPGISHTFIEREVKALRKLGIDITTFSVRRCPDDELLTDEIRSEAARTTVLLEDILRRYPGTHAGLLAHAPKAWTKTALKALRSGDRTARARLWQSFYFAEAAVLHDHMRQRGLRHLHVHFANVGADIARLVVTMGRLIDGPDSGWRWTLTMHGSTEFSAVDKFDLANKVRSATGIACISDYCRSQLMRLVEPEHWAKMRVVPMSVDPEAYTPPADGRRERAGALRILVVGRLVPEKGLPLLVDVMAMLRQRGIQAELRVLGGGPLENGIRGQIQRLGLDDTVHLLGPVGQNEMPDWYRWADVFCLPSFQEGLPVVLMEALATVLPGVATRIAAIPELVEDHRMGRVVAPGRIDLLAEAFAEMANDPERRRRQGQAGREAVLRSHTLEAASTAMLAFLNSTTDPRPTSADAGR